MTTEKENTEETVNYPHEVLIAEQKLTFDELPADIKEAIKDFDDEYDEITKEAQEAEEKNETFELDKARQKKLLRMSDQAATMIYGYIDEKKEKAIADKEAADQAAADKEKADKAKADEEAADKAKADKEAADKAKADKEAADKEAADKAKADKEAADKKKKGHAQVGGFQFKV